MYILLEGMPCTGKTTVGKRLAEMTHSKYMKSVLSESRLGNMLKALRDKDEKTLEYFYLADGMLDELKLRNLLDSKTNIIRDKCFVSSMAHILTHGLLNNNEPYKNIIMETYSELCRVGSSPDLVVLLEPDYSNVLKNLASKSDISEIDIKLIGNPTQYMCQHEKLKDLLIELFRDKLTFIPAFSMSVEQMCRYILEEYSKVLKNKRI